MPETVVCPPDCRSTAPMFANKAVLITGGTGSLGRALVRRLLAREADQPQKIVILSRDEAKQHAMRLELLQRNAATDEIIYRNCERALQFRIGDIRDYATVLSVLADVDIVLNAAAMKQVPTCEYFPFEAVQTNVVGVQNIVRAIQEHRLPVHAVVGISTDKACKPINVMGMTKALQERILIRANLDCRQTRFICVRCGNVLASRGSAIPLFLDQIRAGGPVTITTSQMTRFLMSLDRAVDVILAALQHAKRGNIFVPRLPAFRMRDVVTALIQDRQIEVNVTGIRPGEKTHEILVSEEEMERTVLCGEYLVIRPIIPELRDDEPSERPLTREYSSSEQVLSLDQVTALLRLEGILVSGRVDSELTRTS